jgi:DNA repair photolyase
LVERDLDIISDMAEKHLIHVNLSFTTLDAALSRQLEPRATAPKRRLQTITTLRQANVPVNVLLAPVIPVLTDREMETILKTVSEHGAQSANYILLRLPLELVDLFKEWLQQHYPEKLNHVMQQIQQMRHGNYNDTGFESRGSGQGVMAKMIKQRFHLARHKYQLEQSLPILNRDLFQPHPVQIDLF